MPSQPIGPFGFGGPV